MSLLRELNVPVFAAEGIPRVMLSDAWRVEIEGILPRPWSITLAEIKALKTSRVNCRLTSVSGWSVRATWEGVLWRDFVKVHGPSGGATHVTFSSIGGYETTVPLSKLDHPRVLLAWAVDGDPLEVEYGGPLRMIIPHLWGYKSCKWLARITYTDRMVPGFWETRGYSIHGEIEPGQTMDYNTRTPRVIRGGEVLEF
jgi:DMSO/TMAO reductase YedYZ molybdopterin-dependent catalytic subunit